MLAAQKIQRQFRKKRYVPKKPISLGTEVYQIWVEGVNRNLVVNAGNPTNGPKNSVIILPAGFDQNSVSKNADGNEYIPAGTWIKPVYGWTTKLRISFNHISKHLTTGAICRVHHGVMKIAPSKFGASVATKPDFEAAVLTKLKEVLFMSEINADYLSYAKKSREIKINGSFAVYPNRNHMIRDDHDLATASEQLSLTFPPPRCFTIHHDVPEMKTKIHTSGTSDRDVLLENLWVPWTMVSCERLESDSGYFFIENSSRMYYTDN